MSTEIKTVKLNQSGFGMLAVLIAAAIGMVAIAGIGESIILMIRSQQSIEISRASQLVGDQIEAALANEPLCSRSMFTTGQVIETNSAIWSNQLASIPINGVQMPVTANNDITPQLKIRQFAAHNTGDPYIDFQAPVAGLTTNLRRYRVALRFQTEKKTAGLFPPISAPRDIILQMIVDPVTEVIKSCVAENNETRACEVSGGAWNPIGDPGQKCVPYRYCEWGGAYSTATNGGFLNALLTPPAAGCPVGYTAQQSGAIATAVRTGKTGIDNKLEPIFSCMRCGSATAAPAPVALFSSSGGIDTADFEDTQTVNQANAIAVRSALCSVPSPPIGCASIP